MDGQRSRDEHPNGEINYEGMMVSLTVGWLSFPHLHSHCAQEQGRILPPGCSDEPLVSPKAEERCQVPGAARPNCALSLSLKGTMFTSPLTRVRVEDQGKNHIHASDGSIWDMMSTFVTSTLDFL